MNNKLIPLIITLVVGIILAGSVLIPVLNDATKTEETLTNTGYMRMTHYDDTEDVSFAWDAATPTIVTINDVDIPIAIDSSLNGKSVTVLGDTNWIVRLDITNSGAVQRLTYIPATSSAVYAAVADGATAEITMTEGTMTGTLGTTEISGTYTDIYAPDLNGQFVMKNANSAAYINKDSFLFAYGLTFIGASTLGLDISGDYTDGVTATIWRGSASWTVDNVAVNATANNKYTDIYNLENITLDATNISTSEVTEVTYSYFLVPYQVTSELSQHLTPGQIALVGVIPVFVIVALIVVAVGVVARRND